MSATNSHKENQLFAVKLDGNHTVLIKKSMQKNNQPENKQQSIRKWHKRTVSWGPAKNRSLTYTEIS